MKYTLWRPLAVRVTFSITNQVDLVTIRPQTHVAITAAVLPAAVLNRPAGGYPAGRFWVLLATCEIALVAGHICTHVAGFCSGFLERCSRRGSIACF